jgi:recombination protein RecA
VGMQARLMSRALRRLTGPVGQSKAVVIFINQLREKIGVMYGSPETTPGGKALKYYASVRLDIRAPAGKNIKGPNGKDNIGLGTIVTVKKNKVAPPQKKAEYNLIWGHGIDFAASVFDVAKELGIIYEMPGFYYAVRGTGEVFTGEDGKQLKGKDRIKALFSANPLVAAEIADQCYRKMAEDRTPVEFAAILDGGEPDPETRSDGVDPLDYDGGDLT